MIQQRQRDGFKFATGRVPMTPCNASATASSSRQYSRASFGKNRTGTEWTD